MNLEFKAWLTFWLEKIDGKMEIRPIKTDGSGAVYSFFSSSVAKDIEDQVELHKNTNVFFGVLGRAGSVGGKESIRTAHCIWADIDFKDINKNDLKEARIEADGIIATFDLRPSLQIASGGGYHLYWFLEEPTTDLNRVERIMKGLVPRLKSDPKVAQIACILRPPGTTNWKYDPPVEVKTVFFDPDQTYSLDDFAEWEVKEKDHVNIPTEDLGEQFNLQSYLKHYRVPVVKIKKFESSVLYCLKACLFEENHTVNKGADNQAAIGRQEGGKLFYQCFHSSCSEKTWSDVREKISGKDSLVPFMARDLAPLIEKFVERATGQFTVGSMFAWLDVKGIKEREESMKVIESLEEKRIITRTGNKNGTYRPVDRNPHIMRLGGPKRPPMGLLLPLNLHTVVKLYPKNVILVAGEKDSGKTAFSMNTAYINRDKIDVRYINSEMGEEELEDRLKLFPDKDLKEWNKITWIEKSSKFEDVIDPDGLNIIDFLEIGKDAFEAVDDIKRVFDRLNKGILLIVMQKRSYKEYAVGGEGTLEKARLAINLEYRTGVGNVCKITVAKNWTGTVLHPKGKECEYKIISGGQMIFTSDWKEPDDVEKASQPKKLTVGSSKTRKAKDPDFIPEVD